MTPPRPPPGGVLGQLSSRLAPPSGSIEVRRQLRAAAIALQFGAIASPGVSGGRGVRRPVWMSGESNTSISQASSSGGVGTPRISGCGGGVVGISPPSSGVLEANVCPSEDRPGYSREQQQNEVLLHQQHPQHSKKSRHHHYHTRQHSQVDASHIVSTMILRRHNSSRSSPRASLVGNSYLTPGGGGGGGGGGGSSLPSAGAAASGTLVRGYSLPVAYGIRFVDSRVKLR